MKIFLVGIGAGNPELLTEQAKNALFNCDVIIGAERIVNALSEQFCRNRVVAVSAQKIVELIGMNKNWNTITVALSGDVGFYSGAKSLKAALIDENDCTIEAVCGISSVQYFCARLLRPWQNMHLVSAHGVGCNVVAHVLNNEECFFLTDEKITPNTIAKSLCDAGLVSAIVTVAERLSYPDERITSDSACEIAKLDFDKLCVVIVDNKKSFNYEYSTLGLEDEEFIRGDVPMTKQEVRAVALSKLKLKTTDIAFDIGAGTGSVSVEMALACREGHVFAIETNESACALIKQNKLRFELANLTVINGTAPNDMQELPAPNAVFIGGTKGSIKEILHLVLAKNKAVRVVISAISLESLAVALESVKQLNMCRIEVSQISASRTNKVGSHHMLMGLNPIFLVRAVGDEKL